MLVVFLPIVLSFYFGFLGVESNILPSSSTQLIRGEIEPFWIKRLHKRLHKRESDTDSDDSVSFALSYPFVPSSKNCVQ